MKEATEIQLETLTFIYEYIQDNKISPTVRDVAAFFKIATRAADDRLQALDSKGYIDIESKIARGITLTGKCYYWRGYDKK